MWKQPPLKASLLKWGVLSPMISFSNDKKRQLWISMKLSDFNNKYRMGDSLLVKVENLPKIKQVILFIVLRLAEQDNYDERTMSEFKNVKFVFSNVGE